MVKGKAMSASPFEIVTSRPDGVLRCEVWNTRRKVCVKSFSGRTAKRRAIYTDIRKGVRVIDVGTAGTKGRKPKVVAPDEIADFRSLPFPNESFWHVVFDPPHFYKGAGATGRIAFDFGLLNETWRNDLRKGFAECFRVLKPCGTLVFKWCEAEIPLREVLALTDEKPLYGHRSGKKAQTNWVCFMKSPAVGG